MKTRMPKILFTFFLCAAFCGSNAIGFSFAKQLVIPPEIIVSEKYLDDDYFDDEYEDEASFVPHDDTFRAWNTFWHNINDYALIRVLKPVHSKYSSITTPEIRTGFKAFRENIKTPKRMLNAFLQGDVNQFFIEIGRFIVNTTTSLGFADVAGVNNKPLFPYTPENLRFGYTLAKWGFPEGAYFVIPFYGPSTIRETVGTGVDAFSNAFDYLIEWYIFTPTELFLAFNGLDDFIPPYEAITSHAIDPYVALRNAYLETLYLSKPIVSKPKK